MGPLAPGLVNLRFTEQSGRLLSHFPHCFGDHGGLAWHLDPNHGLTSEITALEGRFRMDRRTLRRNLYGAATCSAIYLSRHWA